MAATRFEVEKFNGKTNFGLWQVKVIDLVILQGLHKTLKGNSIGMLESDWEDYNLKARNAIHLCLADEVLYNIFNQDFAAKLSLKFEMLYMIKSLTNRFYLKQKLYTL